MCGVSAHAGTDPATKDTADDENRRQPGAAARGHLRPSKSIDGFRWCSCGVRDRTCSTPTVRSTSICCPDSVSHRSVTLIPDSRMLWPSRLASWCIHLTCSFIRSRGACPPRWLACLVWTERSSQNSGTEAVEACLKFARRYWFTNGSRGRTELVAFDRSFHGRTFGALSVTAGVPYREPFEPLVPGVTFVSPNDPASLQRAVSDRTAAIIVEPIQGEGGIWPLSAAMANAIRTTCAETGTLLIADEIQCGLGRTGHPFHSASLDLQPDLMPIGKALGGGVPVGAALMTERVAEAIAFGDHGSTYGGNLLACRAALVFLGALEDGLGDRVRSAGARLEAGLRRLAERYEAVREIRGAGLMWGLDVDEPVAERMVVAALEHGLIINRTAGTVIRLLPPLTISDDDIDAGLTRLDSAIESVIRGGERDSPVAGCGRASGVGRERRDRETGGA